MADSSILPENNVLIPLFSSPEQDKLHNNSSIHLQIIDSEHQEIKQAAVKALHQNSILTMQVIASGESPARTKLRMLRYITCLPQPSYE
ncbi:13622_t:CDS:2 [Funneliformis geosporum]|uniref:11508_t:CDS:1 n=1 Tax=Funneliformis geosporum TaxID=1117311 RepID=A0A9W4SK51_9GLOM|nr:13622_t:CDS:2 [Funneliformis geosporum]CAI2171531.1 11508_t:CDS:2 [Funneliformis geosporum]